MRLSCIDKSHVVLIGDSCRQGKEANRMPGVKKLHQESKNSAKGEYIFGYLFGAIGILMGMPEKWFRLSLFVNLQDGTNSPNARSPMWSR